MKALLVAENDAVIQDLDAVLAECGYDVIVYRWLLKALDNIEEIRPHLIVVSAEDYPRHWKTLVQFMSGASMPNVVLYTGGDFSGEDSRKAEALHVRGVISGADGDALEKFRALVRHPAPAADAPADSGDGSAAVPTVEQLLSGDEQDGAPGADGGQGADAEEALAVRRGDINMDEDDAPDIFWDSADTDKEQHMSETDSPKQTIPCSFVFTNPITLAMVFGTARNFDGETLEFTPDIPSFIMNLESATEISVATLKAGEQISEVHAEVVSNDGTKLVLRISR